MSTVCDFRARFIARFIKQPRKNVLQTRIIKLPNEECTSEKMKQMPYCAQVLSTGTEQDPKGL